jgi:hypothetical protein
VRGGVTLLQRYTYEGDNASAYFTPWFQFPSEYANAQLVLITHSIAETGTVGVQLQTTWDTSTPVDVGIDMDPSTPSTQVQDIASGLGPLVRLRLRSNADAEVVISVFLVPQKS